MKLRLIAFTEAGLALAASLRDKLAGQGHEATVSACFGPEHISLHSWTQHAFAQADGLLFIGAVGIAVRAVAPFIRAKAEDPAVVVVDEAARFSVALLSGHLGGANELAAVAARLTGALPVVTTATDLRGVWAVDDWARRQDCAVLNPERIKSVSGRLLAGGPVRVRSAFPIEGAPPRGVVWAADDDCDVLISIERTRNDRALRLAPRIAVLGVGCRKGTPSEALEEAWDALLDRCCVVPQAVKKVCTIDLKREEPGLLSFCRTHGLPLETYSARELQAVPGRFASSAFVKEVTGVDNVCERSAALGSGGTLRVRKTAGNGVTMALALSPFTPSWTEEECK